MGKNAQSVFDFNRQKADEALGVNINFDIIRREITLSGHKALLYYFDGLCKDEALERVNSVLLEKQPTSNAFDSAQNFAETMVTYGEIGITPDIIKALEQVHSGCIALLCDAFDEIIILKARGYPQRSLEEPENDKVLRGPHISFVETIVKNSALLRRHIKDDRFYVRTYTVGSSSQTVIALCYMDGKVSPEFLSHLEQKIAAIQTDALGLGVQSLSECFVKSHWYNPLPKFRYTERPDTAAASIMEGSVILLCDNSPEAIIFPVSIFDFLQQTEDFYVPPLTGTWLRLVRLLTCVASVLLTPLWYLTLTLPPLGGSLAFLQNVGDAAVPVLLQLLILEVCIDGLKLASLNTPDMLANSLSVVGGLILGDYAVEAGWFTSQTILYMAFVAIANFTQHNYELAYSFKYMRMFLLLLVALFGVWGLILGLIVIFVFLATNKTVEEKRRYFYPLIPFNGHALLGLFIRLPKQRKK